MSSGILNGTNPNDGAVSQIAVRSSFSADGAGSGWKPNEVKRSASIDEVFGGKRRPCVDEDLLDTARRSTCHGIRGREAKRSPFKENFASWTLPANIVYGPQDLVTGPQDWSPSKDINGSSEVRNPGSPSSQRRIETLGPAKDYISRYMKRSISMDDDYGSAGNWFFPSQYNSAPLSIPSSSQESTSQLIKKEAISPAPLEKSKSAEDIRVVTWRIAKLVPAAVKRSPSIDEVKNVTWAVPKAVSSAARRSSIDGAWNPVKRSPSDDEGSCDVETKKNEDRADKRSLSGDEEFVAAKVKRSLSTDSVGEPDWTPPKQEVSSSEKIDCKDEYYNTGLVKRSRSLDSSRSSTPVARVTGRDVSSPANVKRSLSIDGRSSSTDSTDAVVPFKACPLMDALGTTTKVADVCDAGKVKRSLSTDEVVSVKRVTWAVPAESPSVRRSTVRVKRSMSIDWAAGGGMTWVPKSILKESAFKEESMAGDEYFATGMAKRSRSIGSPKMQRSTEDGSVERHSLSKLLQRISKKSTDEERYSIWWDLDSNDETWSPPKSYASQGEGISKRMTRSSSRGTAMKESMAETPKDEVVPQKIDMRSPVKDAVSKVATNSSKLVDVTLKQVNTFEEDPVKFREVEQITGTANKQGGDEVLSVISKEGRGIVKVQASRGLDNAKIVQINSNKLKISTTRNESSHFVELKALEPADSLEKRYSRGKLVKDVKGISSSRVKSSTSGDKALGTLQLQKSNSGDVSDKKMTSGAKTSNGTSSNNLKPKDEALSEASSGASSGAAKSVEVKKSLSADIVEKKATLRVKTTRHGCSNVNSSTPKDKASNASIVAVDKKPRKVVRAVKGTRSCNSNKVKSPTPRDEALNSLPTPAKESTEICSNNAKCCGSGDEASDGVEIKRSASTDVMRKKSSEGNVVSDRSGTSSNKVNTPTSKDKASSVLEQEMSESRDDTEKKTSMTDSEASSIKATRSTSKEEASSSLKLKRSASSDTTEKKSTSADQSIPSKVQRITSRSNKSQRRQPSKENIPSEALDCSGESDSETSPHNNPAATTDLKRTASTDAMKEPGSSAIESGNSLKPSELKRTSSTDGVKERKASSRPITQKRSSSNKSTVFTETESSSSKKNRQTPAKANNPPTVNNESSSSTSNTSETKENLTVKPRHKRTSSKEDAGRPSKIKRSQSKDDAASISRDSKRDSGISISEDQSDSESESDCKPMKRCRRKAKGENYDCAICSKSFKGVTDLRRHLLIHANEKPHVCEICNKAYRQNVNLKNHMKVEHSKEMDFICRFCMKPFPLKQRLKLHLRTHVGEKPFSCPHCPKTFVRSSQLQQHLKNHDPSENPLRNVPPSPPVNKSSEKPPEENSGAKDCVCKLCNLSYETERGMRHHMNLAHGSLTDFECQICEKLIQDDLATHMKTHAISRPHQCEVCKAVFAQRTQYNVHMRTHTGERPYQCRVCWQSFGHTNVLKLHIRKHTGEKPFKCVICKQVQIAFSQLSHLKTHMKTIHKEEGAYICEGCRACFKIKFHLDNHLKTCEKVPESSRNPSVEEQRAADKEADSLAQLRYLMAVLLKKISTPEKLALLGFEKRLIDNVLIAALQLADQKAYDDRTMNELDQMKLNIEAFLEWIVPKEVMDLFKVECPSIENILDKIVSMYLKKAE